MASWRTGPNPASATGSTQPEEPSLSALDAAAEPGSGSSQGSQQWGQAKGAPAKCLLGFPTCILPDPPREHPVPT